MGDGMYSFSNCHLSDNYKRKFPYICLVLQMNT